MNIKYLTFLIILSSSVYADNCLTKYKTEFDNKQINLVYDSSRPNNYLVGKSDQDTKDMCITTYKELTKYIDLNYHKSATQQINVITGWNYLAVDKHIVYDYLNSINPGKIKREHDDILSNSDFKSYTVSNQANYQFISIVNNKYACYTYNWFMMATAMANPDSGMSYQCALIKNPRHTLKISQIVTESSIVNGILTNDYIQTKLKSKPTNTTTYTSLTNKFRASGDDELNCLSDSINSESTGFVINNLNPDGTINITLGLTSDIHVCSGILKEIRINNLKPLIKINQVIAN